MRFLKQVLGVRKQTSNIAVYRELGRFPLESLKKNQDSEILVLNTDCS